MAYHGSPWTWQEVNRCVADEGSRGVNATTKLSLSKHTGRLNLYDGLMSAGNLLTISVDIGQSMSEEDRERYGVNEYRANRKRRASALCFE